MTSSPNLTNQQKKEAFMAKTIILVCDADHANITLHDRGYALRESATVERMQELAELAEPC